MKKVIMSLLMASALTGCALTPAENVKALQDVNKAQVQLEVAKELKVQADKRADCATIRVQNAEIKLEDAKQNFDSIYKI